jgi:hypothetical protein
VRENIHKIQCAETSAISELIAGKIHTPMLITDLVAWMFAFTAAAYSLVRMRRLLPQAWPMAVT